MLGRVIEVCMGVFMRQEARNAENLLAFYRHSDDDKDGNLTWKEFLVLLDAMQEAGGAPKMSPEEAAETSPTWVRVCQHGGSSRRGGFYG